MIATIARAAETLLCRARPSIGCITARARTTRADGPRDRQSLLRNLIGGLPMTGVIVRQRANVQAGAQVTALRHLHGMWHMPFVAALGFLLKLIPGQSCLAGIRSTPATS